MEYVRRAAWMPQKVDGNAFVQVRGHVDDGRIYCVDFEIFTANGWNIPEKSPTFASYESGKELKSKPVLSGMCKWDGCMQWGVDGEPYQFHVDDLASITIMHDALRLARELTRQLVEEENWLPQEEERFTYYTDTDDRVEDHYGVSEWKEGR